MLSVYGCHKYLNKDSEEKVCVIRSDAECATYTAPVNDMIIKQPVLEELYMKEAATFWGNLFQIIFQVLFSCARVLNCSQFKHTSQRLSFRLCLLSGIENELLLTLVHLLFMLLFLFSELRS